MASPVSVVVLYLVHKEERGEDLAFLALIFTQLSRHQFHSFSLCIAGFCIDYGSWFVTEVVITVVDSNVDNDDGDDAMMMKLRMMTIMMRKLTT